MVGVRSILIAGFSVFLTLPLLAEAPAPPFEDVSYDAALKEAGQEHKIVLIDFFTVWCGPCKMLDNTTWRDPGVIKLMQGKAVCLRIDAEKEPALARKFSVMAYPTVVLIRPDGTVIDKLIGYEDAKAFTDNFGQSLAGTGSLQRAQAAVEKAKATGGDAYVQARYNLGQQLAFQARYPEALAEYLWCYDDGMKNAPAFVGVRVSFLLSNLASLARVYPPARDALKTRSDAARQLVQSHPADTAGLADFSALNHLLGDDKATLAFFDQLPPQSPTRSIVGEYVFDLLLADKRYDDAVEAQPYTDEKGTRRSFKTLFQLLTTLPSGNNPAEQRYMIEMAAKEVEALAGAGHSADARDLIGKMLVYDHSPETVAALREHLVRAGHPDLMPSPA